MPTSASMRPRAGQTVRWGIVGTGFVAHAFASDLARVANTQLAAVVSRQEATGRQFLEGAGAASGRVYTRVEDLAADKDLDVVYVATPHHRHFEDCRACLLGGRAVLCEKPFTINALQAETLIDLARRQKVFCMEAMWTRFMPLLQKLRAILQSGELGEAQMLRVDFGAPAEFDPANRFFSRELGGGALLDRGVYGVSLAHWLFGPPEHVSSTPHLGKTGVDEHFAAVMMHPGGRVSQISASLVGWLSNEMRVTCQRGELIVAEPFVKPHALRVRHLGGPVSMPRGGHSKGRLAALRQSRLLRGLMERCRPLLGTTLIDPPVGAGYYHEAVEVTRCLREGLLENSVCPLSDTLAVMRTLDQMRADWGLRYPSDAEGI